MASVSTITNAAPALDHAQLFDAFVEAFHAVGAAETDDEINRLNDEASDRFDALLSLPAVSMSDLVFVLAAGQMFDSMRFSFELTIRDRAAGAAYFWLTKLVGVDPLRDAAI